MEKRERQAEEFGRLGVGCHCEGSQSESVHGSRIRGFHATHTAPPLTSRSRSG